MPVVCSECNGSQACDICDGYGTDIGDIECAACGGTGVCPGCFGDGEISGSGSLVGMEKR